MSCDSYPCCNPPKLVVDETCEVFNVTAAQTLYTSATNQISIFNLSVDPTSLSAATFTFSRFGGADIVVQVSPGSGFIREVLTIKSLTVTPVGTSTKGKVCVTAYDRYYS